MTHTQQADPSERLIEAIHKRDRDSVTSLLHEDRSLASKHDAVRWLMAEACDPNLGGGYDYVTQRPWLGTI